MGSTTGVSNGPNDEHGDTDRIRRNIARTQREMGDTIQEIQHRLSPHYLVQQTKDSVRRAGVSTSQRFIDKVKENPIPAAMVGVGMWLLMRGSDDRFDTSNRVYGLRDDRELGAYDYRGESDRSGFDRARQSTSDKVDQLRDKTSEVLDEARDKAEMARERMSDFADTTRERAHELAETTRRAAHHTRVETRDFMRESPLVAGLIALAAGAILAAVIPETEREDELLGDKRDEFLDRGKRIAQEGMERAREAVETVKDNATNEARAASSTSSSINPGGLGTSGTGTTATSRTPANNPNDIRR